jgi:hypothetical protein
MGRAFPFRGERGKVRNRRYLAVGAEIGEGPDSTVGKSVFSHQTIR